MKRRFYAPVVLFAGLFCAQVVATIHVYQSNQALLKNTGAIVRAGYLAVPNAAIADRLDQWATAFAGGLFFTLSIGAGLSILTLSAVWLWHRIFHRRLQASAICLLIWLLLTAWANMDGWNPAASAYLIGVPLATALAAIGLMPARTTLVTAMGAFWPVSAALILAAMWGLVLDHQMFTTIRDHLLLGNRMGTAIVRAYYGYTLYPAEAFKSLGQRQMKTCSLDDGLDRASRNRIERIARRNDYLAVFDGTPTDLTVAPTDDAMGLALQHHGKTILQVAPEALFDTPAKVLAAFSERQDHHRNFRKMTLVCLLLGFPLTLFALTFSLVGALPNLFLPVALADMVTAALCVGLGALLLVPVYRGHTAAVPYEDPGTALSAAPATRIRALRAACKQRRDITAAALANGIPDSPHVAERYWLARSLAQARDPRAPALLGRLVDDPEPIVACQALWAMGQQRDRDRIPDILKRINTSTHWYVQMYGYRALRSIGWVQPRSPDFSY